LNGRSWGFADNIVPLCVDPADYLPCQGDLAAGLRVSNFVLRRARTLFWDFHQSAFAGLPVTLVGNNPELPGVVPSRDWDDIKQILSHHRFFIHTSDPQLEDGYNTATLEAMAAGLPILGNRNPSSPITDGVDGFLSDNPEELRQATELLLKDRALAAKMGAAARQTVQQRFAPAKFTAAFTRAIAIAQSKCQLTPRRKTRVAAY
jgi:glycosyltransferase involved in cell wall biosynthesis